MTDFSTLLYDVRDAKAYVTLNRADRLNAINDEMPGEISAAVEQANNDDAVRVIVMQGAGRAFCAGYDLKQFAEGSDGAANTRWRPPRGRGGAGGRGEAAAATRTGPPPPPLVFCVGVFDWSAVFREGAG